MTAFSRQFVRLDGELVDAEFDPAGTINIQGHGLPAAFCSEEFHGVERARERTSERARRGGGRERNRGKRRRDRARECAFCVV